jgi:3-deoxy-D-manno-octulosonate cytidylyltransferase
MERVVIVIPARYRSTRLPGKPLADIHGKPMIQRVWERVQGLSGVDHVIVATDDARIFDAVAGFGGSVMMTSADHACGTDRMAEVAAHHAADVYINVQGDEPLFDPAHIYAVLRGLHAALDVGMATLCHPITAAEAESTTAVKVVSDSSGRALYFSRYPIPYCREAGVEARYLKSVGVYAYRPWALKDFARLPRPMIEQAESVEQLRLLAAGIRVQLVEVAAAAPSVDTPACLDLMRRLVAANTAPTAA